MGENFHSSGAAIGNFWNLFSTLGWVKGFIS
jgi:hypothetical protein